MPSLPVVDGGNPAKIAGEIERLLDSPLDEASARTLHSQAVALFTAGPPGEPYRGQMARAFAASAGFGLSESWVELGRCRWNGWGTPVDQELAVTAFRRAAELGSLEGAFLAAANLGYALGRWEEALTAAARALELGDDGGDALTLMGRAALHGLGRERDRAEAERCFERAAEAGNPEAMMELSLLREAEDPGLATELLVEAARRGNPTACFNLGAAHATGRGVPQDLAEAARWYQRASELGHGRASFTLALMFRRGQGVAQNPGRADELMGKAQSQGFDVDGFLRGLGA